MANTPAASPTVSSTVGLKNMVIAPLTVDTEETLTYGDLQLVAGAIEASITPENGDPDIQYADDIEFDVLYPDPELTFTTKMADIPLAIQEKIFGNQIDDNGVLIFDLLTNHGYGTNRVAQYLNEKGIKTKRGTSLWRGTSIRAIIDNPIYIGIYHMQGVQSEPFDHLKIIDEELFMRCQQTVKGRSTKNYDGEPVVFRTDTRSLLTGVIYCGHCGCRLCYNHQHEERKLASGGTSVYDYETYRCYRKISASRTCDGQSSYKATALNEAVENQVRLFLSKLEAVPKERLVELASARNEETYKVAYKQAQKDFENAQKQVTALEEEAVKALTGESQLDLSIVNQMLLKHRAKLEASQTAMEEAQARMQAEQENAKATKAQVDELLSWAECFDKADIGTKHLIVSRLIERVEVRTGYKMHIKFKISLKQFLGQE